MRHETPDAAGKISRCAWPKDTQTQARKKQKGREGNASRSLFKRGESSWRLRESDLTSHPQLATTTQRRDIRMPREPPVRVLRVAEAERSYGATRCLGYRRIGGAAHARARKLAREEQCDALQQGAAPVSQQRVNNAAEYRVGLNLLLGVVVAGE
jgi:hypothetical protein